MSLPRHSSKQRSTAAAARGEDEYTSAAQRSARSALLRPSSSAASADALDDDDATASIGRFGDSAAQFGAASVPAASSASAATSAPPSSQFRAFSGGGSTTQNVPAPPPSALKPFRQPSTTSSVGLAETDDAASAAAAAGAEQGSASAASAAAAAVAGSVDFPAQMHSVRHLHSSVQSTLGSIQTKTSGILIAQERDLLRSFRDRLASISEELEIERKKNESGSAEWVNRCRKLTAELDFVRELTESLSTENKTLLSENRRAARLASTQESDRSFLIKQLVAVKKENARLRFMVEQQIKENADLTLAQQQQQQTQSQQGAAAGLAQLMLPNALSPTPPATGGSSSAGLTQHALAAHNNAGGVSQQPAGAPRSKFQSIHNPPHNAAQATLVSPRSQHLLQQQNLFPQAPANMRAAILAAATTESGMHERAAGGFLAAATAAGTNNGSKSARSASASAQQTQPHQQLLSESRLAPGQEARFKSVISGLKRRLDQECSAHRAARAAYIAEVQGRTQLQHLFKSCVDSVKAHVAERRNQAEQHRVASHLALRSPRGSTGSSGGGGAAGLTPASASIPLSTAPPLDPRSIPPGELLDADRVAIVEWMMSEHSVLLMLFDRIWPVTHATMQGGSGGAAGAVGGGEQAVQMLNAVPLHYSYGSFIPPSAAASKHQQQQQQQQSQQPSSLYPSYSSHFSSSQPQQPHQQQQPQPNQSQNHGTHEITPSLRARTARHFGGFDDEGTGEGQEEDDDGTVTRSPVVSPRSQAQIQAQAQSQSLAQQSKVGEQQEQQHHEVPLAAGRRAAPMQVQQLMSGGVTHRKHQGQEFKERE